MATVLITGANRGLGLELARQYADDGWQVFACARSASGELDALAGNASVEVHRLDVTDHDRIDALAQKLGDLPIDVLINNAGYFGKMLFGSGGAGDQAFGHTDYADWELALRINTFGPMKMAEAFVEHVARSEQKKLITITSMLGSIELNTTGGIYRYRSSKSAVNSVVKSLSIDLAERGILAAAIHPGWVRTAMGGPQADLDMATAVRGVRRVIAGLTPENLGRVFTWDGERLPW